MTFDFNKSYNERINAFNQFKTQHSDNTDWKKKFEVIETDPIVNFGRIALRWRDEACNCGDEDCGQKEDINHIYASAIDLKSGDIYLDCRPRKLWVKNLIGVALRPIVLIGKTLSHVLFIPTFIELGKIFSQNKADRNWAEFRNKSWQSIKDIGRTPLYETAMLVLHVVSVIFGAMCPPVLYKIRQVIGRLEIDLNRIDSSKKLYNNVFICGEGWVLTPCLVPIGNLAQMLYPQRDNEGNILRDVNDNPILEENTEENIKENLNLKGRKLVEYRQENCEPLNDCGNLYPRNIPYISKATPSPFLNQS